MLDHFRLDVVTAVRAFRSAPITTAATILTLAVAGGANLAMFGLIDRALLSPPAQVTDPTRVFTLGFQHAGPAGNVVRMTTTSYPAFEQIRDGTPAAVHAAAWVPVARAAMVEGEQVQTAAVLVSGDYFALLGARAALGRTLLPDDDRAPGVAVAVLSHAFWRVTLGANAGVIGRHLTLAGRDFEIVGVMPPGFSGHSAARTDLWVPLHAAMNQAGWERDPYRRLLAVGFRLRTDVRPETAAAQASGAAGVPVVLESISGARVTPAEHTIAYWLGGVSLLVFAVGLANAGTLLAIRASRRSREFGIRSALGASTRRLLSQLAVEYVVLGTIATGAALVLASWMDEIVRRLLLPSLATSDGLGGTALAVAAAGCSMVAVATLAALLQVRAIRRTGQLPRLGSTGRPRAALLVVQTMLAVLLLAGAGMFGRSLHALASQDFGMRMDDVLLVHFETGPGFVPGQDQLFASALDRLRALPGVTVATPVATLPFTGFNVPPFSVPGRTETPSIDGQLPFLIAATPELFDILDLRLREGRRLTPADETGPEVALVNETMANTIWPGASAIGQCFRIGFDPAFDPGVAAGPPAPAASAPCRRIVGVVHDVRQRSVLPSGSEARLMQYYVPFTQTPAPPPFVTEPGPRIQGLLVKTAAGTTGLEAPIRRLVVGGRSDLPFLQVRPYAQLLEPQIRPWRMGTMLLAWFSGLAVLVAGIGLYAAFAHAVGERRRELAVRMAIGARPGGVLSMVLRQAAGLALAGAASGCVAATIASHWTTALLYGTSAVDPIALGGATALMLLIALVATLAPAITASRADPSELLRAE